MQIHVTMSLNSRFKATKITGQRRIPEERNCCYQDVYVNSFFPCTARLWNSRNPMPRSGWSALHGVNPIYTKISSFNIFSKR